MVKIRPVPLALLFSSNPSSACIAFHVEVMQLVLCINNIDRTHYLLSLSRANAVVF